MSPRITPIEVQSPTGPVPDERELMATAAAAGLGSLVLPGLIYLAVLAAGAGWPSAEALAMWTAAFLWAAGGRARQQIRRLDALRRLRRVDSCSRRDCWDLQERLQLANRMLAVTRAADTFASPVGALLAGVNAVGHGMSGWPCIGGWEVALVAVVFLGGPGLTVGADLQLRSLDDRRRLFA